MAHRVSSFRSAIELLEPVAARLRSVLVEQLDALDCVSRYDSPETLHYLDPPYLPETRSEGSRGDFADREMDVEAHEHLADALGDVDGMVILSGYDNPLYSEWFASWRQHSWDVPCSASGRGSMRSKGASKPRRVETVWLNPKASEALEACGQVGLFT